MDYLREGIHLRGFAQIEPLVAYKNEAFTLFNDLMNGIWTDFSRMIFNVEVSVEGDNGAGAGASPIPANPGAGSSSTASGRVSYSGGGPVGGAEAIAMASAEAGAAAAAYEDGEVSEQEMSVLPQPVEQRHVDEHEQIGRNDPCWCGSHKSEVHFVVATRTSTGRCADLLVLVDVALLDRLRQDRHLLLGDLAVLVGRRRGPRLGRGHGDRLGAADRAAAGVGHAPRGRRGGARARVGRNRRGSGARAVIALDRHLDVEDHA